MTTLAELVTPLTRAQAEEVIYQAIAARGISVTSWKSGGVARTLIAAFAIVIASLSSLQAMLANGGFLDLASGPWLTLLARYVYDVERDTGSFATGTITADNGGGGVYNGGADDLIAINTATGKTYRSVGAWSIGSLQTGVVIPMRAVELGTPSNASVGAVNALETTLLGVTVSNTVAFVGQDEETDASLRQRCRDKLGSLSPNGPRDAYRYVATSTKRADGSAIGVTRTRTIPDGYGGIDLYLATATGTVTGTVGTPGTDLDTLDIALQTQCVPEAVELRTHGASTTSVPVTYVATVPNTTGKTVEQLEADVYARLLAYFSATPIGGVRLTPSATGYVYVDALEGEIARALGGVIQLNVSSPAADVALGAGAAAVLGAVTPTITIVALETT